MDAQTRRELTAVLGRDPGTVGLDELTHNRNNRITGGIWRVAGEGFSYVLKLLDGSGANPTGRWPTSDDPSHWNYWRREALVYETRLPDAYAGSGLRAPHCHAVVERGPRAVALWLEDVRPERASDVPALARAALELGRAQGPFLAGRPLPDAPWLSRRWLRAYVESKVADPGILDESRPVWQIDAVREAFPSELRERLRRLWHERERLLDLLEALPQTLCHLDFWPANLVPRAAETVLVDWAFAGLGALAEDASNLVLDTVADHFLPAASLAELETAVYAAYRDGLREAGWQGEERQLRLGYTAAGVKYCWLLPAMLERLTETPELRAYGDEPAHPLEFVLAERSALLALAADWTDEALANV